MRASGECFAVTAPDPILWVRDQVGSGGVEIDVRSHGTEGLAGTFDDEAAEAALPEGALAVVGAVVPLGEALFEEFEEGADVPHPGGVTTDPSLEGVGAVLSQLEVEFGFGKILKSSELG